MNGIPLPLITEAGAEQRISQIIDHLNALAQETERMFTSIDFKNLNADLANRINSSLTEHQSLEEYASSAKLEKVRKELEDSITRHSEAIANGYVSLVTLSSQLITLGDLHNKYYKKEDADNTFLTPSGAKELFYSREVAENTFVKQGEEDKFVSAADYNALIARVEELEEKAGI